MSSQFPEGCGGDFQTQKPPVVWIFSVTAHFITQGLPRGVMVESVSHTAIGSFTLQVKQLKVIPTFSDLDLVRVDPLIKLQ